MRIKLIACKALFREISLLAADCKEMLDVTYLRQGLHNTPELLRKTLQSTIDAIDEGTDMGTIDRRYGKDIDAIAMGYGLCSNAMIGLSSKKYKLIIPRTDDCIGLLLGSYGRYKEVFAAHPGTFWYTPSWIENAFMPSKDNYEAAHDEYAELYGEENADYLLDTEFSLANYKEFGYIEWERLRFPQYEEYTKQSCAWKNFGYVKIDGKEDYLRALIDGDWDEERFVVAEPGEKVVADYDGKLMRSVKNE